MPRRNSFGVGGGGEPTSSLTVSVSVLVSVSVTTNLLGELVCYVAPYEGLQSRPTSLNLFLSNWAQNRTVVSVTHPIRFLFAYDVTGALIRSDLVYHTSVCSGSRRLHDPGRFGSVQVGVREREIAAVLGLADGWMDGWMDDSPLV